MLKLVKSEETPTKPAEIDIITAVNRLPHSVSLIQRLTKREICYFT
jgi:hypothetical protein